MPLNTFSPGKPPTRDGSAETTVLRVRRARFGDGYEQRAPDGLNPYSTGIRFTWQHLTPAQADDIVAFFVAHIGQAFLYTVPGEGAPRQWQVTDGGWVRDRRRVITHAVEVTFEQVFDL